MSDGRTVKRELLERMSGVWGLEMCFRGSL